MRLIPLVAALATLAVSSAHAKPLSALGSIPLKPCRLASTQAAGSIEAECAEFTVAENAAEPSGRQIKLRIAVLAARANHPDPDPMVFLAGGPGQSSVEAGPLVLGALNPLLSRRHVLLIEQRGTGESNPLRCALPDWKRDATSSPAAAAQQAKACLAKYEGRADTRFYATDNYIDDLELVRKAAGIEKWNLVGGSYGTRVALQYLRRHPAAIRSAFIDSVVPPELALGQDHAKNLDAALDTMARRCASDPNCLGRYGDLSAQLRQLKAHAEKNPKPVTFRHPRTNAVLSVPLTGAALIGVARLFVYSPETLSVVPYLVSEAAQGRPEAMLANAERVYSSVPDQLAHGMELSVLCAEDADLLRDDPADEKTLLGPGFPAYIRAQCELWPHATRDTHAKEPVVSDVPVLLLSGQYDPVTPPRYAEQVARTLSNSRALLAKGQGHTPMSVGCMPRLLKQFVEQLKPKEIDASCLEVLGDTPFFLDAQGPAP